MSWLPSVPANLASFPAVKLFQPPLVGSSEPEYDGLVAVPKWHALDCSSHKGHAKMFRCEGLLKPKEEEPSTDDDGKPARRIIHKTGIADGVAFPDVEPYTIGVHWSDIEMTLPEAVPLATL